jgi:hypothetical protein
MPFVCRFEEACAAYTEGGRPELGLALLQQLADNAVLQCRFADAAHGCYKLALESLKVIGMCLLTASGIDNTAMNACCLHCAAVKAAHTCIEPGATSPARVRKAHELKQDMSVTVVSSLWCVLLIAAPAMLHLARALGFTKHTRQVHCG